MLSFLRALGQEHGKKAIQAVTDKIVDLDPATASKAQLDVMETDLNKAGVYLSKVRADAQHDRAEAEAVKARFARLQAGAQQLNANFEAETDPTKKDGLSKSLNGLLTTLESVKHELDQDESQAAEAEKLVGEAEDIYREKAQQLTEAKATLAHAAHDLEHARVVQQRATEQAEHAAELAGLREGSTTGLNAALESMKRQTEAANGDAETKRLKASVLSHAETGGVDDPNVQAALAAVNAPDHNLSFADRLAALSAAPTSAKG